MNRSPDELRQHLESLTSRIEPRRESLAEPPLEGESRVLRDTWVEFGRLVAAADAESEPIALSARVSAPRVRSRWWLVVAGVLAASLVFAVAWAWPRGGDKDVANGGGTKGDGVKAPRNVAKNSPKRTPKSHSRNTFIPPASVTVNPLVVDHYPLTDSWNDGLDETLSRTTWDKEWQADADLFDGEVRRLNERLMQVSADSGTDFDRQLERARESLPESSL